MTFNKDVIKNDEKAIFALRSLYQKYGYRQYKMSKFEEYDLYARNKDFLVSDSVITFTDIGGKLMALKPDVTLSIIKNSADGSLTKVYYNENVYRVSGASHTFKEIMQTGLECIGDIDMYNICEVIMLAIESLSAISSDFVLDISHMGLISEILSSLTDDNRVKEKIITCLGEKNFHGIRALCTEKGIPSEIPELICTTYGRGDKVIEKLKSAGLNDKAMEHVTQLECIYSFLKENGIADKVNFDFSIVCDMKYYSSIVFKGYINTIADSVLTGGQYGKLLTRMGKKADAIGFAVYLDMLERLNDKNRKYDVDTVLLYDGDADVSALSKNIKMLTDIGTSVLAAKSIPDIKYRQLLKFNGKGVEILENNG
ncbi:MAG: ATP phosphoribosyltransferase regulatory subunit [Clostridia bacterium]|nr:ATP phosphoribosyltransferase regulatory subunit [Clostridia bacterium]